MSTLQHLSSPISVTYAAPVESINVCTTASGVVKWKGGQGGGDTVNKATSGTTVLQSQASAAETAVITIRTSMKTEFSTEQIAFGASL